MYNGQRVLSGGASMVYQLDPYPPDTGVVQNTNPFRIAATWAENLDQSYTPAASSFSISGAGRGVSSVTLGGGALVNIIADLAFSYGESITLSYTKPAVNFLRETNGTPIESFSNFAVTNSMTSQPALSFVRIYESNPTVVLVRWGSSVTVTGSNTPAAYTDNSSKTLQSVAYVSDAQLTYDSAFNQAEAEAFNLTYIIPSSGWAFDNGKSAESAVAAAFENQTAVWVPS